MVQHAALPNERRVVTALATLAEDVEAAGLGSPAIVIVGDVLKGIAAAAFTESSTLHRHSAQA